MRVWLLAVSVVVACVSSASAQCTVIAPLNGGLGDCPAVLAVGATCQQSCSLAFPMAASPAAASCATGNVFTPQVCSTSVGCAAGSVGVLSINKYIATGYVSGAPAQGRGVALSSDSLWMFVAAKNDGAGSVFVWSRSSINGAFVQIQRITANNQTGTSGFADTAFGGMAASFDGSTLVVGSSENNVGATYVFVRVNGMYTQQARIAPPGNVGNPSTAVSYDGVSCKRLLFTSARDRENMISGNEQMLTLVDLLLVLVLC
jgi:hypothetical protein